MSLQKVLAVSMAFGWPSQRETSFRGRETLYLDSV